MGRGVGSMVSKPVTNGTKNELRLSSPIWGGGARLEGLDRLPSPRWEGGAEILLYMCEKISLGAPGGGMSGWLSMGEDGMSSKCKVVNRFFSAKNCFLTMPGTFCNALKTLEDQLSLQGGMVCAMGCPRVVPCSIMPSLVGSWWEETRGL
jgi:hypothetical protein